MSFFANMFSQLVACLLILSTLSFTKQFFILSPAYELFFSSIVPLALYLKSHHHSQGYVGLLYYYYSEDFFPSSINNLFFFITEFHCVGISRFIYLPVDGYLSCFISLRSISKGWMVGHLIGIHWTFKNWFSCCPKWLYHFAFRLVVHENSSHSTFSQTLGTISLFNRIHSISCTRVSHCGFNLNFNFYEIQIIDFFLLEFMHLRVFKRSVPNSRLLQFSPLFFVCLFVESLWF